MVYAVVQGIYLLCSISMCNQNPPLLVQTLVFMDLAVSATQDLTGCWIAQASYMERDAQRGAQVASLIPDKALQTAYLQVGCQPLRALKMSL